MYLKKINKNIKNIMANNKKVLSSKIHLSLKKGFLNINNIFILINISIKSLIKEYNSVLIIIFKSIQNFEQFII